MFRVFSILLPQYKILSKKQSEERIIFTSMSEINALCLPIDISLQQLFMQSGHIYHLGPFCQFFVHERAFFLNCFQDKKDPN